MTHVTWGIIIASGKDQQLTSETGLAFLSLGDRPLISYCLQAYEDCPEIDGIVVVAQKDRLESVAGMAQMFGFSKLRKIAAGGTTRRTSLQNGLKVLDDDVTIVSVHDASRPCVSTVLVEETVKAAKRYGTGIAAAKMSEPVKEVIKGQKVASTLDHTRLWTLHSPLTFKREVLQKGLEQASAKNQTVDDESAAVEGIAKEVHLVPSSASNIKVEAADYHI